MDLRGIVKTYLSVLCKYSTVSDMEFGDCVMWIIIGYKYGAHHLNPNRLSCGAHSMLIVDILCRGCASYLHRFL